MIVTIFAMGVACGQDVSTIWIRCSQDYAESDTGRLFMANTAAGTYGKDSIGPWYVENEYPPCFCWNVRWMKISTSEPGEYGSGFIPLDVRGIPINPAQPDTFQLFTPIVDPGNYRIDWPDPEFLRRRCDSIFLVDNSGLLRDTSGNPIHINMITDSDVTIATPALTFPADLRLTIYKYGVHLADSLNTCFVCPVEQVREVHRPIPNTLQLLQNYPNPFNPSTTIEYDLPRRLNVRLSVYDVLGRPMATIVNGIEEPGTHRAKFDASHLSGGVYFYRLSAGNFAQTRKLILMK